MSGAAWRTWVLRGRKLEVEAAGFMEDRVHMILDRLVTNMLDTITQISRQ